MHFTKHLSSKLFSRADLHVEGRGSPWNASGMLPAVTNCGGSALEQLGGPFLTIAIREHLRSLLLT